MKIGFFLLLISFLLLPVSVTIAQIEKSGSYKAELNRAIQDKKVEIIIQIFSVDGSLGNVYKTGPAYKNELTHMIYTSKKSVIYSGPIEFKLNDETLSITYTLGSSEIFGMKGSNEIFNPEDREHAILFFPWSSVKACKWFNKGNSQIFYLYLSGGYNLRE